MVLGPGLPGPERLPQLRPRCASSACAQDGRPLRTPIVAAIAKKAAITTGIAARQAIFEKFQLAMNASGPFIPLLQPAEVVVGTKGIKNLQANGLWLVDLRNLS